MDISNTTKTRINVLALFGCGGIVIGFLAWLLGADSNINWMVPLGIYLTGIAAVSKDLVQNDPPPPGVPPESHQASVEAMRHAIAEIRGMVETLVSVGISTQQQK